MMLAQLLDKHGLRARVHGVETIASTSIFHLDTSGAMIVCVSYLDASSPAHIRYTIRRLRRRLPHAKIMLGCWLATSEDATSDTVEADGRDHHPQRYVATVSGCCAQTCTSSSGGGRC